MCWPCSTTRALTAPCLLGQSLGGMVALRVALRHPDRTAAWVNSDSSMAIDHPELMACVAAHLARASVQTLEQRALSAKFNREHPDKAFLYAQISAMNPSAHTIPVADWRARMQALNHPDVLVPTAQLTSLRCPTLFITGSADPILPGHIVREIAALVPGAACEFIDGAGHSAYFEQPAVFNHMLHTFLQQRVPGWAVATG